MRSERYGKALFAQAGAGDEDQHARYIDGYLAKLDCQWVIIEENYLDRDYMAEFSAYYGSVANPYPNHCKRIHFFSGAEPKLDEDALARIARGDEFTIRDWQERFLGFSVIRPIRAAPFGRTVLRLFPDSQPIHPRNVNCQHEYQVHIQAGCFRVPGLAWQQQDTGVSACATISLWTMFHSVARREGLTVPTTVEITKSATRFDLSSGRPFPSVGLNIAQLSQAIQSASLAASIVDGDTKYGTMRAFTTERFTTNVATLLRAGFPVLILGRLEGGGSGHAVCAVGFRASKGKAIGRAGIPVTADSAVDTIYVHDDNVGPAVKAIIEHATDDQGKQFDVVILRPQPPITTPGGNYPALVPTAILAAVPHKLRMPSTALLRRGLELASHFTVLDGIAHIEFTCYILANHEFYAGHIRERLADRPAVHSRVCIEIARRIPSLSKDIGLIEITNDGHWLADFLLDTTDSPSNARMFGVMSFHSTVADGIDRLAGLGLLESIPHIHAY